MLGLSTLAVPALALLSAVSGQQTRVNGTLATQLQLQVVDANFKRESRGPRVCRRVA
jgi:hypothetical protein